ncbi:MAG TPA: nucleotide pyrophosphohydrolase [Rhodocyclaceae bacterium]|nr:nucleotide pyrophosphohydrolase [Rhodocyclaceae bacterium]
MKSINDLRQLRDALREFGAARQWRAYHSPKNLSMALSVEVAELLEHFQWLTAEESLNLSCEQSAEVADEVADVLLYLTQLADVLGIDLLEAASRKLVKNAIKYPPTV